MLGKDHDLTIIWKKEKGQETTYSYLRATGKNMVMSLWITQLLRYIDREDQMPIITVNARLTGTVTLTSQVRSIIRDKHPGKKFQFPWKKITYWKNMHDWAVIQYPGSQMWNVRQELFDSFPDSSCLEFKASFGKIPYPRMTLMHQPTYVYDQW